PLSRPVPPTAEGARVLLADGRLELFAAVRARIDSLAVAHAQVATKENGMRKQRIEQRRPKLPPILEIDEDGVPVNEMGGWPRPMWSADGEERGLTLEEWPSEYDD